MLKKISKIPYKIFQEILFILHSMAEYTYLLFDKRIRVRFSNFWFDPPNLDEKTDFFLEPLAKVFERQQQKYRIVHYSKADIQFFSVFGRRHILKLSRAKQKIFYTGECVGDNSHAHSYTKYQDNCIKDVDLSLGFDFLQNEKYHRLPLWLLYFFKPYSTKDEIRQKLNKFWQYTPRNKFCALVASHDKNKLRTEMYNSISKISAVDCAGKLLHNDDTLKTRFADNKDIYLRQYKFNICPENAVGDGYVTEKLFEALHAGCIPIYYGYSRNPEPEIINPDIMLWFEAGADNKTVLARIKDLYTDEQKYKDFMSKKCFLGTAVDKIYDYLQQYYSAMEKIAEKACK